MRKGLTDEWSIELDGEFASRVVDHSLQFVAPGRTIWIGVFNPPADQAPETTLEGIKRNVVHPAPDGRIEEWSQDGLEVRYASWYSESGNRGIHHSVYGYTIRRGSLVASALISDSPSDTEWALAIWRSLSYESPST